MLKTKKLNYKNFILYDDIQIKKGKINFVIGESGCGKSTLLKLFNRTENFFAGEILYKDKPINLVDTISLRKEVKLISQTTFLFSGTIRENFALFYRYCEQNDLTEESMNFFLKQTEANFSLDTLCEQLSGGEKQRVYLAICLSMESETIMLDEPTSALDYDLSVKVLENIISYTKGTNKTIIIVSHDHALVEQFAENIIDLKGAKKDE